MRPDQMPRQPAELEPEQPDVVLTNAELAAAIKYAFDCAQSGCTIGKNSTESTETMLAHLKELTALQARRAALFVVPSSAGNNLREPGTGERQID